MFILSHYFLNLEFPFNAVWCIFTNMNSITVTQSLVWIFILLRPFRFRTDWSKFMKMGL